MRIWRLCKRRYLDTPFDGEGARRYGGRWNSPGNRMVYTADSAALATLEALVNLEDTAALRLYGFVPANIEDGLIQEVDDLQLADDWRQCPPAKSSQRLGDQWLEEATGVALSVPSAVVPGRNILLNPAHPRFSEVEIREAIHWTADPRLAS